MTKPSESFEGRPFKPDVDISIHRCSSCGDVLSDQEIGQSAPSKTYITMFCAFCFEIPKMSSLPSRWKIWYWKLFKNQDYQIWILKIKLRDVVEMSDRFKKLNHRYDHLLQEHYNELFPGAYSETLNSFQKEYHDLHDSINDLRYLARNAFNNCLGKFGTAEDDQAPTIRTVSFVDKVIMVRDLKIELENLQRDLKNGVYDAD